MPREEAGLTLNANKCELAKHSTAFLAHIIDGRSAQNERSKKLSYAYHCPRAATVHGHGEPAGEVSPGLGGLQRAVASTSSQRRCLVVGRRARAVLSAFERQTERDRDYRATCTTIRNVPQSSRQTHHPLLHPIIIITKIKNMSKIE